MLGWLDCIDWKKKMAPSFLQGCFFWWHFIIIEKWVYKCFFVKKNQCHLWAVWFFTIYFVMLLLSGGLRRRTRMWKIRIDSLRCTCHMLSFYSMLLKSIRTTCTKCLRMNIFKGNGVRRNVRRKSILEKLSNIARSRKTRFFSRNGGDVSQPHVKFYSQS